MKHSFHRLQMVRWDVSWIVGWDLDRLLTCKVCWPRHNDVWKCWLWIWCWWWFNRRGTLLRLESWHQEYRLDLGWLHIFGPSELDFASWRRSFQLSVLASLIASVASWQTSIHCCRFWWIVSKTWFRVQILAHMCGVIQGLDFLLGFIFSTWVVTAEMRISLKRDIWRDMFGSSGRLLIFGSTLLVKLHQSTLLRRHLAALGMTGW